MPRKNAKKSPVSFSHPPSMTPEGRENEVVALAYNLAEEQIRNGTASSQVITHFLKLGTVRERLEREILSEQKKLVAAKTENIESYKQNQVDYKEVIAAMKRYSGEDE